MTDRATGSRRSKNRFRVLVAFMLLVLTVPATNAAQGCPMCRETAAFQKGRAVDSLKRGILVLAIPPTAVALGLIWVTWKRSDRFADDD